MPAEGVLHTIKPGDFMVDKDKDIESPRGGTALKLDKGNVAES